MTQIFNFCHRLRQLRPIGSHFWHHVSFRIGLFIAFVRGCLFGLRGILIFTEDFQPSAIGATSRSIFEKDAAVEIKWSRSLPPLQDLESHCFDPRISLGNDLSSQFLNPVEHRRNRFRLLGGSRVKILGRVHVGKGFYISLKPRAELIIEDRVYVGKRFYCAGKTRIHIKSGCLIGDDVKMIDYDGHQVTSIDSVTEMPRDLGGASKQIVIEDNCWISSNVMIIKGVTIGRGSVVSANSFVTRSVPPNSLVMGNPARIVKSGVAWQNY